MVPRERLRQRKLPLTNPRCEYSSLAREQNPLCPLTFGSSSRFCSRLRSFISTSSDHKFLCLKRHWPHTLQTHHQKRRLGQLTSQRAPRQKARHRASLSSLRRKSQYTCPTYTHLQHRLPLYLISVLGHRSNAMVYHRIRCPIRHN